MRLNFQHWNPWSQVFGCIGLGVLASLAYAPISAIPCAFVAFPLWLYILQIHQKSSWQRIFVLGWSFGLGYFTGGLYWITFSLGTDISAFWWLIPFSLLGIPSILSIYIGLIAVILQRVHCTGISRCFWFASLWTIAEVTWGSGSLGLPWNPLGSMWSSFSPLLQSVSVIGVYGLTLITALWVSTPILLEKHKLKMPQVIFITCQVVILVGASSWGMIRPHTTPTAELENPPFIRLVQPSLPQDLDWSPEKAGEQFFNLMNLSSTTTERLPDLIVWPESALPLLLDENTQARETIAKILKPDAFLLSGSLRREFNGGEKPKVYNSMVIVDAGGNVITNYDKTHLVPFGEYLPLRQLIPDSITKITAGETDFSRGQGLKTISLGEFPAFSPLICYEVIFSGQVISSKSPRAQWILVITNDAWYGHTSGPYQHLQLTRLRSIEEGLPLVRAANSGISAVFDAFGREIIRKDLGEKGVVDAELPPALRNPTLFSLYGQLIFIILLASFVLLGMAFRKPPIL